MPESTQSTISIFNESVLEAKEFLPLTLPAFFKKDIPPVEYYLSGLLCKQGKTMISAQANIGKSLFVQNLALAITSGKTKFLDKFDVSPARVLYLDLEMGESALKDRFLTMCAKDKIEAPGLYVKYLPNANFLDVEFQKLFEKWLEEAKVDVVILDPIGNAWQGDENDKQEVGALTAYLNTLIAKYKVSIIVIHHWRKGTKEFKTGGEMAAGSYKWAAWLDYHITLSGAIDSMTVSCEKSRHGMRFKSFLAKLNTETLGFEFITDFEKKFNEQTLIDLFDSFGMEKVAIPDLKKRAKENKVCSDNTIRGLINESTTFRIDKTGKTHYLVRKGDLFDESDFN